MLVTSIFSFSHSVLDRIKDKKKIIILSTLILSSANAFNLDQSEILSFGKELKKCFHNSIVFNKDLQYSNVCHTQMYAFTMEQCTRPATHGTMVVHTHVSVWMETLVPTDVLKSK